MLGATGSPVAARDATKSDLWREIEDYFSKLHGPAFGKVSAGTHLAASPGGQKIAFTGSIWEKLEGSPQTHICIADVATGTIEVITSGQHSDQLPQWSPDGQRLAFLSDRAERGVFQLYLLKGDEFGEVELACSLDGSVEYFWWSPSGAQILIGVAGRGSDKRTVEGSGNVPARETGLPAWTPTVEENISDPLELPWRESWIYDTITRECFQISRRGLNVWEANWYGPDYIAAVTTEAPDENTWYTAAVTMIDIKSGKDRIIYNTLRQVGLPVSTPSGARLALIEALCSDRALIAGNVLLIDRSGSTTRVDTARVDVTQIIWRGEDHLFFIGLRGLQTVAGEVIITDEGSSVTELWVTSETCGLKYPSATLVIGRSFAVMLESWTRYPTLAIITDGDDLKIIASLDHEGGKWLCSKCGPIQEVRWKASDGLEIQGLLCLPNNPSSGPYPLVLNVHGGPVSAWRNQWEIMPFVPLLVSRGYVVFCPNPRGSSGRGQEFAEMVLGDVGGADADDHLTGVDMLIERGIADPKRIATTGRSYGGYMSAWLVTQTDRFAAGISVSGSTDWRSRHTLSNIAYFDQLFLDADPYSMDSRYFTRSPVAHAGRYRTPFLQIAGQNDRAVVPSQAIQYHHALVERGVKSAVVVYPDEGHGIRKFPAYIDYCYRLVAWLESYMPASES
ncbi:prolyl endopeptidase [Xylogone sp. PMI_703]|nr:prolyl endopeptidase [Xylogone sp. PMI_703]